MELEGRSFTNKEEYFEGLSTEDGVTHTPVFTKNMIPLYPTSVVSRFTHYSNKRINQLARGGKIRGIKLEGAGWLVNPSDVLNHKKTAHPGRKSG